MTAPRARLIGFLLSLLPTLALPAWLIVPHLIEGLSGGTISGWVIVGVIYVGMFFVPISLVYALIVGLVARRLGGPASNGFRWGMYGWLLAMGLSLAMVLALSSFKT